MIEALVCIISMTVYLTLLDKVYAEVALDLRKANLLGRIGYLLSLQVKINESSKARFFRSLCRVPLIVAIGQTALYLFAGLYSIAAILMTAFCACAVLLLEARLRRGSYQDLVEHTSAVVDLLLESYSGSTRESLLEIRSTLEGFVSRVSQGSERGDSPGLAHELLFIRGMYTRYMPIWGYLSKRPYFSELEALRTTWIYERTCLSVEDAGRWSEQITLLVRRRKAQTYGGVLRASKHPSRKRLE